MSNSHKDSLMSGETSSEYDLETRGVDESDEIKPVAGLTRFQTIGGIIGLLGTIAVIAGVSAYILQNPVLSDCVVGTVEDCSAKCDYDTIFTKVTPFEQLTRNNSFFPNPYVSLDGSSIASAKKWTCRRAEISAQLQTYELGMKPAKPEESAITASIWNGSVLATTITHDSVTISFDATIRMPKDYTSTDRVPAMILLQSANTLNQATFDQFGIATIKFPADMFAQQINSASRGLGLFYNLFGKNHSAGALMAWSWGVSRMIDALQMTTDNHMIDVSTLGVTGCSRYGKGALVIGAFDERIALTIPQESGAGGSASYRLSEFTYTDADPVQRLRDVVTENVWFRKSFAQFGSNVTMLPYDHHMLQALVAPRGLLTLENVNAFVGNFSSYANSVVGHSIYADLGVSDNMGVSQRTTVAQCEFPSSQQRSLDAFLQKFLLHQTDVNTSFVTTDQNYTMSATTFVNWKAPW